MVNADAEVVEVTEESDIQLFKAFRGGGGGNFGIVTRFKFRLQEIGAYQTSFRFGFKGVNRRKAVEAWLNAQADFPNELTSFVRLNVQGNDPSDQEKAKARDYSVYAGGLFYGKKEALLEVLKPWMDDIKPDKIDKIKTIETGVKPGLTEGLSDFSIFDLFGYDDFSTAIPALGLESSVSGCSVPPPDVNCNIPHPHKVSSAFPKQTGKEYNAKLAEAVDEYIKNSDHDPYVRSYMTFHAMGGAISEPPAGGRAFPYANKEFLLQFQSWWNYPEKASEECMTEIRGKEKAYIRWVTDFRKTLDDKGLVEGAFINFIDRDLVADYTTLEGRLALLKYYYADNLQELRDIKKRVDSKNRFNFEMSIPPL